MDTATSLIDRKEITTDISFITTGKYYLNNNEIDHAKNLLQVG